MSIETDKRTRLFDLERLLAGMDELAIDALVAHTRRNVFYLSTIDIFDYLIDAEALNYVVFPRKAPQQTSITIPMSERIQLRDNSWIDHKIFCGQFYVKHGPLVSGTTAANSWQALLMTLVNNELSRSRVGFELEQLPVTLYQQLKEALPHLELVDISPLLRQLRTVKTEEEIRRLRIACRATEEAIEAAAGNVHAGMSEHELAHSIGQELIARGTEVLYVQVATAATAGLGLPSEHKITESDIIRTDVAAVYQGYTSDLGRSFSVGRPAPEYQRLYQTAHRALDAGIASIQPGHAVSEIFAAAMAVWQGSGFPEVTRHHIGHGLGLQAHEAPMIKPSSTELIEPGMVLAVEVPCYVYGVGGFAPEDVVVVGSDSIIRLTHAPAELPIVG